MPSLLTVDAALGSCSVAIVVDERVIAVRRAGDSASLPTLTREVLDEAGARPEQVAVTVGPGSFTGLRAALALAHGIGLGSAAPVTGVTVGAALASGAPAGRRFWAAIDSRRRRVFLERDGAVAAFDLWRLPGPDGPIAVAGDAAVAVASRLAARGADVQLLESRFPDPLGIARAVARGATRPAQPLYVDPPEATPGLPGRPAPT